MKKTTMAMVLALSSMGTQADTLLGIYAGAGVWGTSYSGDIGNPPTNVEDTLGIDDQTEGFYYVALEHFVPLVPNVKLQHTTLSSEGEGTVNVGKFIGGNFNEPVATDFDLTHTDLTLYYEILDNWVNLDVGLTVRMLDGFVEATGRTTNVTQKVDVEAPVPMLYGKAQFDLPLTGLSIGGDINTISFSGNSLIDTTLRVNYEFDVAIFDLGFELGYRTMALQLEDIGDLETDVRVDGPYASAIFHF